MAAVGEYTGEILRRTRPKAYREIVQLLANGVPKYRIAKQLNVSTHSVDRVEIDQAQTIAEQKQGLRAIWHRVGMTAVERLEDEVADPDSNIKGIGLATTAAIAADKVVALSDNTTTVNVNIAVEPQDIYSQLQAITAQIISALPSAKPALPSTVPILEAELVPGPDCPTLALPLDGCQPPAVPVTKADQDQAVITSTDLA